MGTPLPEVNDGVLCSVCWGVGKQFGAVSTPDVIKLSLTSQLPGEFFTTAFGNFLLTTQYLNQDASPCNYVIEANDFRFRVVWQPGRTVVLVTHLPTAHGVFSQVFADECSVDLENELQVPEGTIMFGGFANITFV